MCVFIFPSAPDVRLATAVHPTRVSGSPQCTSVLNYPYLLLTTQTYDNSSLYKIQKEDYNWQLHLSFTDNTNLLQQQFK